MPFYPREVRAVMDNPYASPLSGSLGDNFPSAWVRQVPVVATLLLMEGVLEECLGLLLAMWWEFSWLNVAFIMAVASLAILKMIAGIRNRTFRNRRLGLAALGSAILSMATFFCLPTALLLALYGFVIYLHPSVSRAFRESATVA